MTSAPGTPPTAHDATPNWDDVLGQARAARRALEPDMAVQILERAIAAGPPPVVALVLLGRCQVERRDNPGAIAAFDRAIALDAANASAHAGRAIARMRAGQMAPALADGLLATKLDPDLGGGWIALGRVFSAMGQPDLAAKAFRRAVALAPDVQKLKGLLLREQVTCCDWDGLDALVAEVAAEAAAGRPAVSPFYWHALSPSSESLLQVARQASAARPFAPLPARVPPVPAGSRLRIGYVSGELSTSANALCMAGVFEAHDRRAFETVAFDNGRDDGTALRRRVAGSFDELVPVAAMSDRELAAAVADRGIDVLVNLNGFFGNDRSAAFRFKPAPVQVNYLGCPGTMGAPYMDYVVADATVIPADEARFYDEKIAWLPDSYYPTDRARPIAARVPSRQECGLPAEGFVFCCFNTAHKILPDTFASWMRILASVPDSVLWLIAANPAAMRNLRAEAAARGVDPARLVFATHVPPADHLARHACADLFLDTLPYNAHTTAVDALWSGVPVLTLAGKTWPGRVAASLLRSIGMPDLVVHDADEYERRAVGLALDREALGDLRTRLAANRLTTPLFDTATFTRHLETAYRTMVERHRAGLPPASFSVTA